MPDASPPAPSPRTPPPAARGAVAVIGAGLAGLACARALADRGLTPVIFEKSRGVSGRSATRRATLAASGEVLRFDHGAQYFTVRDARFAEQVARWEEAGAAAEWRGRVRQLVRGELRDGPSEAARAVRRWVGVPGMSALGRTLAEGLDVRTEMRVGSLERAGERWALRSDAGAPLGAFDLVAVAVPAPQAAELLAGPAPALAERAAEATMTPCWSVMLAVGRPLGLAFDAAFVGERASGDADGSVAAGGSAVSPLSWVARDSSKPGRECPPGVAESWVLHATPAWSAAHLEHAAEAVGYALVRAFAAAARVDALAPVHLSAHRWRYATPAPPLDEACLHDAERRVGAAGDWCGGPRVEGAFVSGLALAERIAAQLGR